MRTHLLLLLLLLGAQAGLHGTESKKSRNQDVLVRSKRRWVLSTIELTEEEEGIYPMEISKMFNDKTVGKNHKFKISGEGVEEKIFSINEITGVVYAHRPVDREVKETYHIRFNVFDGDNDVAIDKELAFDVNIIDINDNAPQFKESEITANVKENTPEGYLPVHFQIHDSDERDTPNSKFSVSVVSQEPALPKIDVHEHVEGIAQLRLTGCFDYDEAKQYKIIVEAKDFGTPSLSSQAVVTINIVDSNSHPPKFKERKYYGEAHEFLTTEDILRISIEDGDTPNTDASRAKYYFITGNEKKHFHLTTDPKTNEGVLSVIQGKPFDHIAFENLTIGVENAEPLFICKDGTPVDTTSLPQPDSVHVTVKMIDGNDPPVFKGKRAPIYRKEEEEPGVVLYTPDVHDVDSTKLKYVLLQDPADWLAIDSETGTLTTTKKMDRESPFVDSNVYRAVITVSDDGEPANTATETVQIYLVDINDNNPRLVDSSVIMCANKENEVTVLAKDADADPFGGPFYFALDGDDSLKEKWKLSPIFGEETTVTSLKPLPFGNYSLTLRIEDKQNHVGHETLHVTVCDCEHRETCRGKFPQSSSLGSAAIGLIIAGLLVFLLLLLIFKCDCKKRPFKQVDSDEGNQTLIKYNQEGGGAACMSKPTRLLMQTNRGSMTELTKKETTQLQQMGEMGQAPTEEVDGYGSVFSMRNFNLQSMRLHHTDSFRSYNGQHSMRNVHGINNYQDSFWRNQQHSSLQSQQRLAEHIKRRLLTVNESQDSCDVDQSIKHAYEGEGSSCQSLDELSFGRQDEDLTFLDDLGQRFESLGNTCQLALQEKDTKL